MKELAIYEYYPCPELDYMLLGWLQRMAADGELDKTISCGNGTPSEFLMFFRHRRLFFTVDEFNNLSRACWVESCMGSVFIGYYIHPNARTDQANKVYFLYDIIDAIFRHGDTVPVIVGFIQQRPTQHETEKFIQTHVRLGYTYRGYMPKFFDGKDCHIVAITREDWEGLNNEWKRRWATARGHVNGRGQEGR